MTTSPLNEFSLIKKYFEQQKVLRQDVLLGIGDDGAVLRVPSQADLVLAIDTLVAGVHFPTNTSAEDIAYKALAVNLSDLAAMGAEPCWMSLALTLPQADALWLKNFSRGLFELAEQFNVQLVGGDTTRGPLTVTIQVNGFVTPQRALCRTGAKVGDKIYVTGTLGDAGLALQTILEKNTLPDKAKKFVLARLNRPSPLVALGLALRGIASSAIDISDGLLADLGHILEKSAVGAEIMADKIPLSFALQENLTHDEALQLALNSGDDYELCFTVPTQQEVALQRMLATQDVQCHCIGTITATSALKIIGLDKIPDKLGFEHFVDKKSVIPT